MKAIVKKCCASWCEDQDYCRMSQTTAGWGCRLLVCIPETMPKTVADRKRLFERVYTYAQECGVLDCPHFREAVIDEVIDSPDRLSQIVRLGHQSRADLLSTKILEICN